MKTYNIKTQKMIRTSYVCNVPVISEVRVIWYEKSNKVSVDLGIDTSILDEKEITYIEGLSFDEAIDYLHDKSYIEVPDSFDKHEKDTFNMINIDPHFKKDFFELSPFHSKTQ